MDRSPIHLLRRLHAGATALVARKAATRTARQADPASGNLFLVAACCLTIIIITLGSLAALDAWADRQDFAAAMAAHDARRVTARQASTAARRFGPAERMTATFYGEAYCGRKTASGVVFDCQSMTAAHRTLPFGTRLQVAYQGRQVEVVINDRGPMAWTGRDLDLSKAAFAKLAPLSVGVLQVHTREVIP